MTRSQRMTGFTLIELAVVIIIISLVTAMGFVFGKDAIEAAQRVNTQNKLDEIEKALLRFRLLHDRLPCPGNPSLATNHASYGASLGGGSVACTTNGETTPPFLFENTNLSYIAAGSVPVRALGLPDEFMYDGWGRKFEYAVDPKLTETKAFVFIPPAVSDCSITVTNGPTGTANAKTASGAYTLVSAGPNGHGGYTRAGARYNAGSTNANELANCHCDSTATSTDPNGAQLYVDRYIVGTTTTTGFDDITRFKERWQLQNEDDRRKSATYKGYDVATAYSGQVHTYFSRFTCQGWTAVATPSSARTNINTTTAGPSSAISPDGNILMMHIDSSTGHCNPQLIPLYGEAVATPSACSTLTDCIPAPACPDYAAGNRVFISDKGYMAITNAAPPYMAFSKLSGTKPYQDATTGQLNAEPIATPITNPFPDYTGSGGIDHAPSAKPTIVAFSKNTEYMFIASPADNYGIMYVRMGDKFLRVSKQPTGTAATDLTCNGLTTSNSVTYPVTCASVSSAAFSPDGKYFAVGYLRNEVTDYPTVEIWKISKGTPLVDPAATGYDAVFEVLPAFGGLGLNTTTAGPSIAFSPDGRYFVAAAGDGLAGNGVFQNIRGFIIGDNDTFTDGFLNNAGVHTRETRINTAVNPVFTADSNHLLVPATFDYAGVPYYGMVQLKRTEADDFFVLSRSYDDDSTTNAFHSSSAITEAFAMH